VTATSGQARYVQAMALVAIDMHTHVMRSVHQHEVRLNPAEEAIAKTFGAGDFLTVPELVEYYRARAMAFVTFVVDDRWRSGRPPAVSNEEIAELAAAAPDVVVPFASADPHRGREGIRALRRLVTELGCQGVKFHPSQQAFQPNDSEYYPIYEALAELGVPALFHTGQTAVGRGQPGGGGIKLGYSNPMFLDDVAADIPELTIVLAHPSFPWQEEAISVALHKPNVYIDLSGWAPKYFPDVLVRYVRTQLQDKVLFGSDYPAISPDRWLAEFDAFGMSETVRAKVLRDNALKVLPAAAAARLAVVETSEPGLR
jgi:uncharacterized protein